MNKQFTPYDIARDLRDLGFNEPVMAWYHNVTKNLVYENSYGLINYIPAPLWQQATEFLRMKGFHVFADCNASGWYWHISKTNGASVKLQPGTEDEYRYHIKALDVGIRKAIEILKQK